VKLSSSSSCELRSADPFQRGPDQSRIRSILPAKADIRCACLDVRFVPKADIRAIV
jgi:hypothetical protein